MIGALGIVFGDIGTSPLYALRECFVGAHALSVTPGNVLGIVSIVFWSLVLVVCFKYVTLLMRADNHGEGGILALMALVTRAVGHGAKDGARIRQLTVLGILGAALLYGDGIITPAISVLSAVEGLNVATTACQDYVIPLSAGILTALFLLQRRGTAGVGSLFGPVLILWFVVIGGLGLAAIVRSPDILQALLPVHAVRFFLTNHWHGFLVLGTVFLTMTGAEVLYADMGHFGRVPIRRAWYGLVLPALLLNYFGQGALLLRGGGLPTHLFYELAPSWFLYPLILLATAATVIASQAVISGTFSLARQAVQLGLWPRLKIVHTSSSTIGQVYVPLLNLALFLGTIGLIFTFRESGRLAGAYGIAVSATMLITSVLFLILCQTRWKLHRAWVILLGCLLLPMDLAFFCSNAVKIQHGGWIVLVISLTVWLLMQTWISGGKILRQKAEMQGLPLEFFLQDIRLSKPYRAPGTAVFLSRNPNGLPRALLHNYKHNMVLHTTTILLNITTEEIPFIPEDRRFAFETLGEGICRMQITFGFSETPDIPNVLARLTRDRHGVEYIPERTTFFLGKESLVLRHTTDLGYWRKRIFAFLSRNARDASAYFCLPANRVVELGLQIEL